jgi:hypothetical protein
MVPVSADSRIRLPGTFMKTAVRHLLHQLRCGYTVFEHAIALVLVVFQVVVTRAPGVRAAAVVEVVVVHRTNIVRTAEVGIAFFRAVVLVARVLRTALIR